MKLVELAVKRPVTITILVGVLIILGWVSFSRLGVDLYPDMKFPVGAVLTTYNGAGPEEVESQVSQPLEGVLGTIANVKEITSYSLAGSSIVVVQFNWGTDMEFAALNMREKIALVEKYLPQDAEKPMVVKMGRFGKFIACSGFPECRHTESIIETVGVSCPKCGGDILVKRTRAGRRFYGCKNYPRCDYTSWTKPGGAGVIKKASLE